MEGLWGGGENILATRLTLSVLGIFQYCREIIELNIQSAKLKISAFNPIRVHRLVFFREQPKDAYHTTVGS